MSANDFAKSLFQPPANKENINNFLVAYRDLKTQLLLADDNNTLKFEEDKPTKVINAQNGELTVDRNSSLFIFLKATFEKPETSLYEKQQILNLTEQWLKDPFINSYHVSEMKQYIGDLIALAQAEKSPLLKTAGENLIDSFNRA